ncbi:MAG TPA: FimV/HubP family polar landmark protein, partial [Xanthobacteraceae bacterium]|nr:FimV/HubP family polar landmark protein [Xanthobacteraceae bacterium]
MKGPVKLSLAVALALAGSNAFALGLGAIQVKSGLNQPLDAEIPVLTESATEAAELTVDLASAADFERVGLNRARLTVPLEMAVTTNARGQTVIKVTTKDAVREPLIDFLIVANWTKGKVLREYTVLLDPPVTAPARGAPATVAPVAEKPAAATQPLAEPKPAPPPKAARPEAKPPVAAAPQKPPKAAPPPPAPAPPPKPAAQAAAGNDYGPVAQGETLSEIARATRPDEKTNINQMMLALLKANPKAFYQDNINALKRGAILRIPNSDDIRATGAIHEAVAQVHSQNEAWTSKAPVTAPTLVAHTGTPATAAPTKPASSDAGSKQGQERLALVPPRAGKSDAATDRAGAAGGTGKDDAATKAELARTKEALTSREQEATELKSRVKQLEDISSKDQRLISMKDSEIAELQAKLKALQAKETANAAAAAAKPPVATTAAPPAAAGKPDQKVTAKDIWGDMSAADKAAADKGAAGKPAAGTAAATTTP